MHPSLWASGRRQRTRTLFRPHWRSRLADGRRGHGNATPSGRSRSLAGLRSQGSERRVLVCERTRLRRALPLCRRTRSPRARAARQLTSCSTRAPRAALRAGATLGVQIERWGTTEWRSQPKECRYKRSSSACRSVGATSEAEHGGPCLLPRWPTGTNGTAPGPRRPTGPLEKCTRPALGSQCAPGLLDRPLGYQVACSVSGT